MKLHQVKALIATATGGRLVTDHEEGVAVLICGDEPQNAAPVAQQLTGAGIPFRRARKAKHFAGALYIVPLKNVGTAFHADWQFAQ